MGRLGVVGWCLEGVPRDIVFWSIKLVRSSFRGRFRMNKLFCVLRLRDAGISTLKQFVKLVKIVQAHSGCIISQRAHSGRI